MLTELNYTACKAQWPLLSAHQNCERWICAVCSPLYSAAAAWVDQIKGPDTMAKSHPLRDLLQDMQKLKDNYQQWHIPQGFLLTLWKEQITPVII